MALILEHAENSKVLNEEQEQWLYFRISRPFPKPYRPWPKTKKNFEFKTFSFAEDLSRAIRGD